MHERRNLIMLKRILSAVVAASMITLPGAVAQASESITVDPDTVLWYDKPALTDNEHSDWVHALPVGNGRLGGMVYGRTDVERMQLNETSIWTGGPIDYTNTTGGGEKFNEIRDNMLSGNRDAAISAAGSYLMGKPTAQAAYQPFVDMYLDFGHEFDETRHYRRSLDTSEAVASVDYEYDGNEYHRETIASYPDQVIATNITCDSGDNLSFTASLDSPPIEGREATQTHKGDGKYFSIDTIGNNQIALRARVQDGKNATHKEIGEKNNQECKIDFEARLLIDTDGSVSADGEKLTVSGASYATVYVFGASNFVDYQTLGDTDIRTERNDAVISRIYDGDSFIKTYEDIKSAHIADYRELNDRQSIKINEVSSAATEQSQKPTDKRIEEFSEANDLSVVNLYYNYAKYLIISASRDNEGLGYGKLSDGATDVIVPAQPANLQGIWNNEYNPNWQSKYTINVNIEMIYQLSQLADLNETEIPFFNAIKELTVPGHETAVKTYGIGEDNDAWVIHHNFDIWRGTAPVDAVQSGQWPVGALWLSYHLWERYQYSGDEEFLRDTVYPVLKGAVDFLDGYMAEAEGKDGKTYLVSPVSISPEHMSLQVGPAMDHQMIRQTYRSLIEASEILGIDEEERAQWSDTLSRVAPDFISSDTFNGENYLQEWFADIDASVGDPAYSHLSNLWGLFPGVETTAYDNNEEEQKIFDAYKTALKRRMSGSMKNGWAVAWRQALSARAAMGEEAYNMFKILIQDFTAPNMFDLIMPYHSSFTNVYQLDANIGGAAATAEMLLQSHNGDITLLPALPDVWKSGEIKGMKTRGGYSVDMKWENHTPEYVALTADNAGEASIRYMNGVDNVKVMCDGTEVEHKLSPDKENVFTFSTEAGKTYTITGFTPKNVTGAWLTETDTDITLYKTKQLHAVDENGEIESSSLTYNSSNNGVASVSADGVVTANSVGTAKITVKTADNTELVCNVTVKDLPENQVFYDVDGGKLIFDKSTGKIIDYTGAPVSVSIPTRIDDIKVTGIGENAFKGVTSLETVAFKKGAAVIGDGAFSGCTGLKSVELPVSLTDIYESAFDGCTALTEITIPSSVTNIEDNAFANTSSLVKAVFNGNAPESIGNTIFGENSNVTVNFYTGAEGFASPEWNGYNSVQLPGEPIPIPDPVLTSVEITGGADSAISGYTLKPFTARAYDELGDEITDAQITWSIEGNAVIDGTTVTINNDAEVGDVVKIKAAAKYNDKTVEAEHEIKIDSSLLIEFGNEYVPVKKFEQGPLSETEIADTGLTTTVSVSSSTWSNVEIMNAKTKTNSGYYPYGNGLPGDFYYLFLSGNGTNTIKLPYTLKAGEVLRFTLAKPKATNNGTTNRTEPNNQLELKVGDETYNLKSSCDFDKWYTKDFEVTEDTNSFTFTFGAWSAVAIQSIEIVKPQQEPAITGLTYAGGNVTADFTTDRGVIIISGYDENGALIESHIAEMDQWTENGGAYSVSKTLNNACAKVKCMLWESVESMEPICTSRTAVAEQGPTVGNVIYSEDFENGAEDWSFSNPSGGSVFEDDGNNVLKLNAALNASTLSYDKSFTGTNYRITSRVKPVEAKTYFSGGMILRCKDENNYVMVRFAGTDSSSRGYELYKWENGSSTLLLPKVSADFSMNEWHDVVIDVLDSYISVYIDGDLIFKDVNIGSELDMGSVGARVYAGTIYIDDITVNELDYPAGTVKIYDATEAQLVPEDAWSDCDAVNYNGESTVKVTSEKNASASWTDYAFGLNLGETGSFAVYAWIPDSGEAYATYKISTASATWTRRLDQSENKNKWVKIATVEALADAGITVKLTASESKNTYATAIKVLKTTAEADAPDEVSGDTDTTTIAVMVNQSGYDTEGNKRATVTNVDDGTEFIVCENGSTDAVYTGQVLGSVADFSDFMPDGAKEYYISCAGSESYVFTIAKNYTERVSVPIALEFMEESRNDVWLPGLTSIAWRDSHQFSFEIPSLVLQYMANPAMYENIQDDVYKLEETQFESLRTQNEPNLIWLMKYGAEYYYKRYVTDGLNPHPMIKEQMAYLLYLYPYISDYITYDDYIKYRDMTFSTWGSSDNSNTEQWYNISGEKFNLFEVQTAIGGFKGSFPPGHSILPNLLMYEVALRDGLDNAEAYFDAAYSNCEYLLENIDITDPRYSKGQRMSERVLMEGLSYFQLMYPDRAPENLQSEIDRWAGKMIARSDNMWDMRMASSVMAGDEKDFWTGAAYASSVDSKNNIYNEPGNEIGFCAAAYAAAMAVSDEERAERLKEIGDSCNDNMFGRNPHGRMFFYDAVGEIEGADLGWMEKFADGRPDAGNGKLANCIGRIDASPKEDAYPFNPDAEGGYNEGWIAYNTAWNDAIAYSSADSTSVSLSSETAEAGSAIEVTLKAPVNVDYDVEETAFVYVSVDGGKKEKFMLTEENNDSYFFIGTYEIPEDAHTIEFSYGIGVFEKTAVLNVV